MGKKALVAVSFGTSYPDALCGIENVENCLREVFPEYYFFRAFTSRVVSAKIERETGVHIPGVPELMEYLCREGFDEARCQSLHIMSGKEYDKFLVQLRPFVGRFNGLYVGKPLLTDTSDYQRLARALLEDMPALAPDEALVYMGHGSAHSANAIYALMENCFRYVGAERVYVGTVEGFPGLEYILCRLEARGVSRVRLAPLMLVAGGHAKKDLAGERGTSWKACLEARGYSVTLHLKGLGEVRNVADIFAEHCKAAEDFRRTAT